MGTAYALLIQEDVAELHAAEKAARDKSRTDRVRLLRFVKEGRVPGIAQAAAALGYSARTAERWWRLYCEGGLAALVAAPRRRGMAERITPEAWEGLQTEMRAGHIGGRPRPTCATPGTSPTALTPSPSCSGGAKPS